MSNGLISAQGLSAASGLMAGSGLNGAAGLAPCATPVTAASAPVERKWELDFFKRLQRGEIEPQRGKEIVLSRYEWLVQTKACPFLQRTPRDERASLYQAGRIGLLQAIPGYRVYRGGFADHAAKTVEREVKGEFRAIRKGMTRAAEIGRSVQRAEELMLSSAMRVLSLDAPLDESGTTVHEVVGRGGEVEDLLDGVRQREKLYKLLAGLPDHKRRVLELSFGVGEGGEGPLKDKLTARMMGVTADTVKRWRLEALVRLFHRLS